MATMKQRAIEAIKDFAERHGFEDVGAFKGFVTGRDGDAQVFISVHVVEVYSPKAITSMAEFEKLAIEWLTKSGREPNFPLRFDEAQLVVTGDGRAMLRYQKDCIQ